MAEYVSGEEYNELKKRGKAGKPSKEKQDYRNKLPLVIAVVALCLISFWGGTAYEKGKTNQTTPTSATAFSPGGGRFGGARPSFGTVASINSSSITINDSRSGSTDTFQITSSTKITSGSSSQTIQASSINVGDTVLVRASTSNSSEAATIIDNPSFGGFGPQSQSGSSPTAN
jgi:hypothetical protein